jgi:hypothetical protein
MDVAGKGPRRRSSPSLLFSPLLSSPGFYFPFLKRCFVDTAIAAMARSGVLRRRKPPNPFVRISVKIELFTRTKNFFLGRQIYCPNSPRIRRPGHRVAEKRPFWYFARAGPLNHPSSNYLLGRKNFLRRQIYCPNAHASPLDHPPGRARTGAHRLLFSPLACPPPLVSGLVFPFSKKMFCKHRNHGNGRSGVLHAEGSPQSPLVRYLRPPSDPKGLQSQHRAPSFPQDPEIRRGGMRNSSCSYGFHLPLPTQWNCLSGCARASH